MLPDLPPTSRFYRAVLLTPIAALVGANRSAAPVSTKRFSSVGRAHAQTHEYQTVQALKQPEFSDAALNGPRWQTSHERWLRGKFPSAASRFSGATKTGDGFPGHHRREFSENGPNSNYDCWLTKTLSYSLQMEFV